jgi:hypothetical protein
MRRRRTNIAQLKAMKEHDKPAKLKRQMILASAVYADELIDADKQTVLQPPRHTFSLCHATSLMSIVTIGEWTDQPAGG